MSGAQKINEPHGEKGTDRLRSVGRSIQKTSTGRYGKPIFEPQEEELRSSPIKTAIKTIGRIAATVFLACAVGAMVTACYRGQAIDEEYTLPKDTDEAQDPIVGLGIVCDEFEGADHQAALPLGGRALLAPLGHWLHVAEFDGEAGATKLSFETDLYGPVDGEGNPLEEAMEQLVSLEESTISVGFGGEVQHITFCDVLEGEDGEDLAYFVTDHPNGFMHCAHVDSGGLGFVGEYEFNSNITQSVEALSHHHGFIPDLETGEDPECPGTVGDFKWEESTFESAIPVGLVSLPGMGFSNTIVIRGADYVFSRTATEADEHYLEVAHAQESATLGSFFQSIELNGLTVTWTGNGGSGVPTFSYSYLDSDFISEESVSSNQKTILVWEGSTVLDFSLVFSTPGGIMGNNLLITLLYGVERITEGGVVTLDGIDYDAALYVDATTETISGYEIEGFRVTPVTD